MYSSTVRQSWARSRTVGAGVVTNRIQCWSAACNHVRASENDMYREIETSVYTVAVSSPMLRQDWRLAMSSTVDSADEMSSEYQTERYNTDAVTTSSESTPVTSISLLPFQSVLAFIGYLGILTNGLVLWGFWLSDRSKLNSSSIHIVNHTALVLLTSLWCCRRHFITAHLSSPTFYYPR